MSFLKWYTTSRGTNQTRIIEVWWKSQKPNKNMSRKKNELVVDFNIEIMWFISHINFFHVYHPHTFKYFSHKFRERWKKNISKINVKGDPSIHFAMMFFCPSRCQWSLSNFASNYKCVLFNLTKSFWMFVLLSYGIGLIANLWAYWNVYTNNDDHLVIGTDETGIFINDDHRFHSVVCILLLLQNVVNR